MAVVTARKSLKPSGNWISNVPILTTQLRVLLVLSDGKQHTFTELLAASGQYTPRPFCFLVERMRKDGFVQAVQRKRVRWYLLGPQGHKWIEETHRKLQRGGRVDDSGEVVMPKDDGAIEDLSRTKPQWKLNPAE